MVSSSILGRTGKCTAIVKVALIHCLLALLEVSSQCFKITA